MNALALTQSGLEGRRPRKDRREIEKEKRREENESPCRDDIEKKKQGGVRKLLPPFPFQKQETDTLPKPGEAGTDC